jgi:VIT1/CCC1 family predicted Fe2+/Mn2+ transporter
MKVAWELADSSQFEERPAPARSFCEALCVFGVLLFISPFVLGETSHQVAAVSAYVLGVLLFLSGILAAATREPRRSLILNAPGLMAVITFVELAS